MTISLGVGGCADYYAGYPAPYPVYRGAYYAYDAYPYGYGGYPGYPYYGAPYAGGGFGASVVVRNERVRRYGDRTYSRGGRDYRRNRQSRNIGVSNSTPAGRPARAGVRERNPEAPQ